MADLVDTIRKDIKARLNELRPLVEEAASLEAALRALDTSDRAPSRNRGVARTGRRRGRRGESRTKVIEFVGSHPSSTAGDVAKALRLNRNSVATQLAQLVKAGELTKAARGYSAP
jgi:predicted HTH transcriptional regulator